MRGRPLARRGRHPARGVAWDAGRFIANWARFEHFMVLADEQVAGFFRLLAIDGALEIRDLQLLPSHRNQGIGSWAVAMEDLHRILQSNR